jgi:hypothetical protein
MFMLLSLYLLLDTTTTTTTTTTNNNNNNNNNDNIVCTIYCNQRIPEKLHTIEHGFFMYVFVNFLYKNNKE